ncbi:hypothetical protein LX36DRAFT_168930 [Colletotrichum falcatum]|nr:hypothetical protein LX36DRAFT_168930 [Colletotrichum falcatum]
MLQRDPGNCQHASMHPRTTGHHRSSLDAKQDFFSPAKMTFFASPPPYSSLVTARAQAHGTTLDSRPAISQTTMQGFGTPGLSAKSNIGGHPSHNGLSIAGGSFNSNSNDFLSPEQEEIHGLEAFSLQDPTSPDTHESSIWSADSFDMTLSPAMLSQLDERAFDELFRQVSESNFKADETHLQGKTEGFKDGNTLAKTT